MSFERNIAERNVRLLWIAQLRSFPSFTGGRPWKHVSCDKRTVLIPKHQGPPLGEPLGLILGASPGAPPGNSGSPSEQFRELQRRTPPYTAVHHPPYTAVQHYSSLNAPERGPRGSWRKSVPKCTPQRGPDAQNGIMVRFATTPRTATCPPHNHNGGPT